MAGGTAGAVGNGLSVANEDGIEVDGSSSKSVDDDVSVDE
jgi:hypothetical protein